MNNCEIMNFDSFISILRNFDFLLILEALDLLLVSVEGSILPPVGLHRRSQIQKSTKENEEEQRRMGIGYHGIRAEKNMVYL